MATSNFSDHAEEVSILVFVGLDETDNNAVFASCTVYVDPGWTVDARLVSVDARVTIHFQVFVCCRKTSSYRRTVAGIEDKGICYAIARRKRSILSTHEQRYISFHDALSNKLSG